MHLLLDESRYRKVALEARRRNVSAASVIRDAIDALPLPDDRRRRAIADILGTAAMPVPPDPRSLREELDATHDRKA